MTAQNNQRACSRSLDVSKENMQKGVGWGYYLVDIYKLTIESYAAYKILWPQHEVGKLQFISKGHATSPVLLIIYSEYGHMNGVLSYILHSHT
jgi:hypothetical protein